MFESILIYLWQAFAATLIQILILCGPGLLLTLILHFEIGYVQSRAVNAIGRGWYLGLFAWLGTIIHELGHSVFCLIFGHKIVEIKLFHPDPESGTLGYVKHSYTRTNIYQITGNYFIGIGPILLGTTIIFLLCVWLLGINSFDSGSKIVNLSTQPGLWDGFRNLLPNLWGSSSYLLAQIFSGPHLMSWQLYVFLYLVLAIGSSITLSPPDIKSALGGFAIIVVLLLILNIATFWAGNFISGIAFGLAGYYALFGAIIFLIMLINLALVMILLPFSLKQGNHSRNTRPGK